MMTATTAQKIAISLLIAILLFGVFYGLSSIGILDFMLFDSFTGDEAIVLYSCLFLTFFLTVFLVLNFRQDPVTIIQGRMKRLWVSLVEQFYEDKVEIDWIHWNKELEHRRSEIEAFLKRGIKSGKHKENIDKIMDRSWKELLSITGTSGDEIEDLEDAEEPLSKDSHEFEKAPELKIIAGDMEASFVEEVPQFNNLQSPGSGLFLPGKFYFSITGKENIDELEVIEDDDAVSRVIVERNGVHYINSRILDRKFAKSGKLDMNFKNLVDSVLKSQK